jgi:ankyrin repeat protein
MSGNLELLKEQEAKGGSVDAQFPRTFGWNPLTAAIYHQQTNIINYLLTRNVKLNAQDTMGRTALMWAITVDDTNTVKSLLEKGADVTIIGTAGDAFSYANVMVGNARANRELYVEWLNAYKDKNKSSVKP